MDRRAFLKGAAAVPVALVAAPLAAAVESTLVPLTYYMDTSAGPDRTVAWLSQWCPLTNQIINTPISAEEFYGFWAIDTEGAKAMAFGRDDVCEHGSLERKCEICDRDKRIAELEAALDDLRTQAVEREYGWMMVPKVEWNQTFKRIGLTTGNR